jgi:hypothetical protein
VYVNRAAAPLYRNRAEYIGDYPTSTVLMNLDRGTALRFEGFPLSSYLSSKVSVQHPELAGQLAWIERADLDVRNPLATTSAPASTGVQGTARVGEKVSFPGGTKATTYYDSGLTRVRKTNVPYNTVIGKIDLVKLRASFSNPGMSARIVGLDGKPYTPGTEIWVDLKSMYPIRSGTSTPSTPTTPAPTPELQPTTNDVPPPSGGFEFKWYHGLIAAVVVGGGAAVALGKPSKGGGK